MISLTESTIFSTKYWNKDTDQNDYFKFLDKIYESGFRKLECSAVYPAFQDNHEFRFSESIIHSWINKRGVADLELFIKVGFVNTTNILEEINLSRSFILMLGEDYLYKFGSNLKCLIIPEDRRTEKSEICETISALKYFSGKKIHSGLNYFNNISLYLEELNKNRIKPLLFFSSTELFRLNEIQHENIQDIYIDLTELQGTENEDLNLISTDYEAVIQSLYKKYTSKTQTKEFKGLLIPVKGF